MRHLIRCLCIGTSIAGCASTVVQVDNSQPDGGIEIASREVDLLLVVENSGAGNWLNHSRLVNGLRAFFEASFEADERASGERSVGNLRVGVLSSDLGADGGIPFCESSQGDDAVLNPARFGREQRARHGTMGVNNSGGGTVCPDVDMLPRWTSLDASRLGAVDALVSVACSANLGNLGCGVPQVLEALLRGGTRERDSQDVVEDRFFRPSAVLVLAVISTRDDLSIRPCPNADGGALCHHGASALSFSSILPCSVRDTTTPLSRYHDPTNALVGLPGLKPRHPERVLFFALGGIPVASGTPWEQQPPPWSELLGASGAAGPDDFCGRNLNSAYLGRDEWGMVSMRPQVRDDSCPSALPPSCRRRDERVSGVGCEGVPVVRATQSRRISEIARRFDEAPLCGGRPCRNGFVTSVCEDDYRPAFRALARRVRQRLAGSVE